nr:putative ribonuclease H-like domain-containing protein [Tanacetum cinerariifolium]
MNISKMTMTMLILLSLCLLSDGRGGLSFRGGGSFGESHGGSSFGGSRGVQAVAVVVVVDHVVVVLGVVDYVEKVEVVAVEVVQAEEEILSPSGGIHQLTIRCIVVEENNDNLLQLLDSRGGSHVTNVLAFDKDDFTSWKIRFLVFLDGLEPYLITTLEDGLFVPMSNLSTPTNTLLKRQNQWSNNESHLANQDKRLKSIIIRCLPNDVIKYVIKYKSTKEMWTKLYLAYEGPSDTRDTKIATLMLKFNAFKALKGEKVNDTYTQLICLLNDLKNNGDSDSDVEEDNRTNNKFMAELNAEYHERALLANQKRFYKRCGSVRSTRKPMDKSKETCFACGKHGKGDKGKSDKGLVAESFNRDDESVSLEDEWNINFKAFMEIAEDEPSVGKGSGCSRYMTGVKQYMHRFSKEFGPKVVFGDKSSGDIEGYSLVNCNGITFTKTEGSILNEKDKVVLIASRKRDVYVIDMSSYNTDSNACFYAKASATCKKGKQHRATFTTKRQIENLNDTKVKQLRSDNGTEFTNHTLEAFCDEKGILQNFSSPCTPEKNGVAERRNRTLIEAARTMLNRLRTSSNSRNKNVDTTLRYKNDNQSGQFGNQRTMNVAGAREIKPKKVKDSAYHKEKMLLYKQAVKGVPLQAEQYDWLAGTDEEIDEQELEAHYIYMAKIQEVPTVDTCTDSEPLEKVQNDTGYNVFANDIQNDQNDVECDDERVALANLIANLKLDVDEKKYSKAIKESKHNTCSGIKR